jgi:hypothetical protein
VPALPSRRHESARKDPEPRPVSGVPFGGVEVLNKDPDRWYVLIDEGGGQGREVICPQSYEEKGYVVEHWPSFEGLDGDALRRARLDGLRFAGSKMGRPGEPMTTRGHVLMSIELELYREQQAAEQASCNAIEEHIGTREAYLEGAQRGLKERPRARDFSVSQWE